MKGLLFALVIALAPAAVLAAPELLYGFESGTDGWVAEWGLKGQPTNSTRYTRQGESAMMLQHRFSKKDNNVGVRIVFDQAQDFAAKPGFAGFSAWIYLPSGNGWEAQLYLHFGDDWKWAFGKLYSYLQPGWHQIFMRAEEIEDAGRIRDLGIQIKNHKLEGDASIYIDRVEMLTDNGK